MANLGSDLSQLFSYIESNERVLAESAAARARRTIQELLGRPDLRAGTAEVRILKGVVDDALLEHRQLEVGKEEIENYFLPFSLRVLSSA